MSLVISNTKKIEKSLNRAHLTLRNDGRRCQNSRVRRQEGPHRNLGNRFQFLVNSSRRHLFWNFKEIRDNPNFPIETNFKETQLTFSRLAMLSRLNWLLCLVACSLAGLIVSLGFAGRDLRSSFSGGFIFDRPGFVVCDPFAALIQSDFSFEK
jgi:hypothetical protein